MSLRSLAVAVGWAMVAAIIWLSVTPSPPHIDVQEGDKLGHLVAYGGVMFWFGLLYAGLRTRLAYAAGFVAMGVALEFVQRGLGYRSFELADMAADAVGVLLGLVVAALLPDLFRPAH